MNLRAGDEVVVKNDWPETRGPVHIRTPHYVRGRRGRIVARLGAFPNPEDLAFARPAATRALYHVSFAMSELWPEGAGDEVWVEIFEHWLDRP